jgi:hypothetical protein
MKKSQRGGELAGNPSSAWGWGLGTAGNGWQQFMDTLTVQPGQNASVDQSNILALKKGGKRRHRSASKRRNGRSRKGGNFGAVLSQAVVPLTLLAAQQGYAKRTRKNRKH